MAWHLIKYAVPGYNHADHKEWLIDAKEDINTPPVNSGAMGSFAYTADIKNLYQKNPSGTWVTVFEEEE